MEGKDLQRERLILSILHILALEGNGQRDLADKKFHEIMPVAQSNGFVRLFLDEGELMFRFLKEFHSTKGRSKYVEDLLKAFGGREMAGGNWRFWN